MKLRYIVQLWRVHGPSFVAGVEVWRGRVVRAAPILEWTHGRSWADVVRYAQRRGWDVRRVQTDRAGTAVA